MSRPGDFWARRQAAVQAEEEAAAQALIDRKIEAEKAALDDRDDADILADLNLPDPDTLKPGDDVAGFMAKVVPDRLRRRALRQLWRPNPALANVDGLVDYGGDFTDAALVVENRQTTYQVGKGMLKHVQEMARQAEERDAAERAAAAADPVSEDVEAPDSDTEDAPMAWVEPPAEPQAAPATWADDQNQDATTLVATTPRRMRFEFEG